MAAPKNHHGPKIGLTAEEWVRLWETDFEGMGSDHGHQEHHDHSHGHKHHDHEHHVEGHGRHQHYEEGGCGGQKFLKKYLPKLTRDQALISILVTLCGDSSDVVMLANDGHSVTGIEVSEKAVKSIFENPDKPIPYSVSDKGPFKVYTATDDKKLAIYVGNFFDTLPGVVGQFDAVWDGHGIVSLPESDMKPYADKLKTLIKHDGVMLFSTVSFNPKELTKGPAPYPISTTELKGFFSDGYKVELLEDEDFPHHDFEGITKCTNPVHLISKE